MKSKLTNGEGELLTSLENNEWKPVKNQRQEKRRYTLSAQLTMRKDKRINIRVSQHDLYGIQAKAAQEGIPYQTLIASIIHKYVSGYLVAR